jgi:hypothetical protein
MDAQFILDAIRRKYPDAAIVPEVVMDDPAYAAGGSADSEEKLTAVRRIDALMFQSLVRTAIEIKTSRADFRRDTWAKRRPWFSVCHRFVYVVPADLGVMPPFGCGMWWVHPDGTITIAAKAKVSPTPEPLPQQVVQSLAYRASRGARV